MTTGDFIEDAQIVEEQNNVALTEEPNLNGENTQASTIDPEQERQMREWAEEYARIYKKMHTPYVKEHRKVGRNEICPYCDSGLKFKHCECSQKYGEQISY